ncbi:unnamed protein product [Agarophyton chilense]
MKCVFVRKRKPNYLRGNKLNTKTKLEGFENVVVRQKAANAVERKRKRDEAKAKAPEKDKRRKRKTYKVQAISKEQRCISEIKKKACELMRVVAKNAELNCKRDKANNTKQSCRAPIRLLQYAALIVLEVLVLATMSAMADENDQNKAPVGVAAGFGQVNDISELAFYLC